MTKAIVLCGGKGTRLRPYTYTIPKPMLPLGRKPILEYVLHTLRNAGITEVTLAVGYLHEQIKEYFGDGKKLGMKLSYAVEKKEAGTAGALMPIAGQFKETFVVMMGDHMSNIDIAKLVEFHKKQGGVATVALNRKGIPLEYGVADLEGSRIIRFREKPIVENLVNSGVYVFEPKIFSYIKEGDDFANDVFPLLLSKKERISGFIFADYWLDIGRTTDYEHINQLISIIDLTKGMK